VFAQRAFDRRRFFGTAALSIAAAWIGTRDAVLQLITVEPFRISGAKDLASTTRAINSRRNSGLFSAVCPNVFRCTCEIGNVFR
jgi:hypothetical protein